MIRVVRKGGRGKSNAIRATRPKQYIRSQGECRTSRRRPGVEEHDEVERHRQRLERKGERRSNKEKTHQHWEKRETTQNNG